MRACCMIVIVSACLPPLVGCNVVVGCDVGCVVGCDVVDGCDAVVGRDVVGCPPSPVVG